MIIMYISQHGKYFLWEESFIGHLHHASSLMSTHGRTEMKHKIKQQAKIYMYQVSSIKATIDQALTSPLKYISFLKRKITPSWPTYRRLNSAFCH